MVIESKFSGYKYFTKYRDFLSYVNWESFVQRGIFNNRTLRQHLTFWCLENWYYGN